jgi:hypothetical protein
MSKEKIIISDPGDEVEPIIIKAELIYVAVVIILMSLLIYGGTFITELIEEYRAAETVADNLDYLMSIRKELAIEAFLFSKDIAEVKSCLEQAKAQRKIDFYTMQSQHLDEGLGKSVVYAEKGIRSVRAAEARLEGEYVGKKTYFVFL